MDQQHTPPVLAQVVRGGLVESRHRGVMVAAREDGSVVLGLGWAHTPVFLRSAAKPLQVLPLISSGAADRFGLEPAELAVCAGSLNGQDYQVAALGSLLAKAGLGEEALDCGVHRPSHRPTARLLEQRGEPPRPIHNNCAGKHAAMLAICRHLGWPLAGYTQPHHPVQRLMLAEVARMTGVDENRIATAVDGCGAPVFHLPLSGLAAAYARLAVAARDGQPQPEARLTRAALGHPEMIAGDGRLCTRLMRARPGALLAKTGAEGVYALALVEKGWGVAIWIEDGRDRALGPVVVEALAQLDQLDAAALESLADLGRPGIKNHRGEEVGGIVPVFRL